MLGRGGYWCNSPAQTRIACSKIFIVSVFNYERGVGEMLEDFGHRSESILWHVYGSWEAQKTHAWNRFTLYDKQMAGEAACGNVHYAPNSDSDYDWGNTRYVWSTCDDWLNYPNLTGTKKWVNSSSWGYGDIRQHHRWWFYRFPHVEGSVTEYGMTRLNNWWEYTQNFNRHAESGGDHPLGGTAPAAAPYPRKSVRITTSAGDDWAPRINAAGRMVWHSSVDGTFEILAADVDGRRPVRITSNTNNDEDPKINASGRVVWQGFDGNDYEIYSANADGTGLVQITNNATNDWHPQISDAGRIVWDGFDGTDYEIYSANADGSDLVQITSNSAVSGYPREDVWPQINSQNRVVWYGYSGSDWEIYSANADGSGLVNLSSNSAEDEYPQISDNGYVVWHRWYSDYNAEIMSAPATGGTPLRLTNNAYEDWYPQINATGQVVWMARMDGDWEILTSRAVGGGVTRITTNSTHDQYPQINAAGQITWQGFDGSDWEIYTWRDGQVEQVTNNATDDRWPALNAKGQIAWHGESDATAGNSEIFAVSPIVIIPPDFDKDGDVDLEDFALMQVCMTLTPPTGDCEQTNMNADHRIDQADAEVLISCLSGPGIPAKEGCAD
jgi:Tol biopolymer transport system component